MQHIEIQLVKENGEIIKNYNFNFALVLNQILGNKDGQDKYPLLRTVSTYGDTVFNILQAPLVVSELKDLSTVFVDKVSLEGIIRSFNEITDHTYIKLIGD